MLALHNLATWWVMSHVTLKSHHEISTDILRLQKSVQPKILCCQGTFPATLGRGSCGN